MTILRRWVLAAASALTALGGAAPAAAQDKSIVMASTTSTEQSGLFGHLLPLFKQASGIDVRVVAVGTGQALDAGRRGDADIVFVHDTAAEEKFVAEGFATGRLPVMYNDFIVVGPKSDPARAKGNDIAAALAKLKSSGATFISRSDKSGTHAAELRLWKAAGVDIGAAKPAGYKECGCGMGPALNIASSSNAYVLTDRGTWLSFKNRGDLVVLVEGDKRLFNQYGVMVVNPAKHPHVKAALAQQFADWVVSPAGQKAIADYKIGGEQLFFPNANRSTVAAAARRRYAGASAHQQVWPAVVDDRSAITRGAATKAWARQNHAPWHREAAEGNSRARRTFTNPVAPATSRRSLFDRAFDPAIDRTGQSPP